MRTTWMLGAALVVLACNADRPGSPPAAHDSPMLGQSFSGSTWSEAVRLDAPVNDPLWNEQGPAVSADELSLYFCSNRPPSRGNDLWVSRRASRDAAWGDPVNLGAVVNSTGGDCGPSLSDDGLLLFFTSSRAGGAGQNDIYVSRREDSADDLSWGAPVPIGAAVNTAIWEYSPFISRWRGDECEARDCSGAWAELYFERATGLDLASRLTSSEVWMVRVDGAGMALGEATLVREVNSARSDAHATVRFDGREMILHSNRDHPLGDFDLYASTRQSVNHSWSTPVRLDGLSAHPYHEIHPYFTKDGRSVYFVRGSGVANDIFVATRH